LGKFHNQTDRPDSAGTIEADDVVMIDARQLLLFDSEGPFFRVRLYDFDGDRFVSPLSPPHYAERASTDHLKDKPETLLSARADNWTGRSFSPRPWSLRQSQFLPQSEFHLLRAPWTAHTKPREKCKINSDDSH
jgi:hypothetical protein